MRDKLAIVILVVMGLAGQFAPACLSGSKEVRLEGVLYTKNVEKNLFILKSGDHLYRFFPKNASEVERLRSGDAIAVTAVRDAERELLLHDAKFRIICDNEPTAVLWAKLSSGGWHDGLFRVLTYNDEYWQVNFAKGEGTVGLKSETYYTFRGDQDYHLSQTINNASVYDTVRRKISLLEVMSVDSGTGWIVTRDFSGNEIRVYSVDHQDDLAGIKKGNFIRADGFQDIKDRYGPIMFASVSVRKTSPEAVDVEFIGEVLDLPSKENGNRYSVRECNSIVNFESAGVDKKISAGDWVKVKGRVLTKTRLCVPSSVVLSSPAVVCTIFGRDPVSRDLQAIEPDVNVRWTVQLSDKSKSKNVPFGTMLKVSSSSFSNRKLISCKISDIARIKGFISDIDQNSQIVTIESVEGKKTMLHIKPEMVNLSLFEYEDCVEAYGLCSSKSSQEGHIFEGFLKKTK
ncbi:MAG: hypothetical protein GX421_01470 [Caldisericales bacterium]|nr:hypothetical protein [Caldisericales bacterium]